MNDKDRKLVSELGKSVVACEESHYSRDGFHAWATYPNNYSISVIRHEGSYGGRDGLYELAVGYFTTDNDFVLVYDTPITNDAIGHLSVTGVVKVANQVKKLPLRLF